MQDEEQIANAYWVLPDRLLAGEHPFASHLSGMQRLKWLIGVGINHFIDLTQEEDHQNEYAALLPMVAQLYSMEIHYARFAIADFGLPTEDEMQNILTHIHHALQQGHRIYLHCQAGIGRTGLVVGCFLVCLGLSGEEALKRIQELRRSIPKGTYPSPETEAQRQMIMKWKGCQKEHYAL